MSVVQGALQGLSILVVADHGDSLERLIQLLVSLWGDRDRHQDADRRNGVRGSGTIRRSYSSMFPGAGM